MKWFPQNGVDGFVHDGLATGLPYINGVMRMKTLIIKSLLTSLCQSEECFPSIKRGLRGVFPSLEKRGEGRFFNNDASLIQSLAIPSPLRGEVGKGWSR